MLRASASRQPSISFRNSTSTSDVPRFRLDAAYWSKAPDQTASRENTSHNSRQRSGYSSKRKYWIRAWLALSLGRGRMVQS